MTTKDTNTNALLDQCWDEMIAQPAKAAQLAIKAQAMASPNSEQYCEALGYLGLCLIYEGKFEASLNVLNEALVIAVEYDQTNNSRLANNALGMCYHALGRYSAAFDHFEFAAELARKIDDPHLIVPPLINMASLMYDMGDLDGAEQTLTELMGLNLVGVVEDNLVEVYLLQTQILISSLNFEEAKLALKQTEELAQKLGFHFAILRGHIQHGRLLRLQGRLEDAIELFKNVIADEELEAGGTESLEVFVELAKALFSLNQPETAVAYLKEGLQRITPPESSPVYIKVLEQFAHGYHELGRKEDEVECFKKILHIERSSATLQTQNLLQLRDIKRKQEQDRLNKLVVERENQLLKDRHDQLNLLNDIAHQITMTLDFEQLGQRLFSILAAQVDVHFISILTLDEMTQMLNYRVIVDSGNLIQGDDFPVGAPGSNASRAVLEQRHILVAEVGKLPEFNRVGQGSLEPRSMLFVPLILEDEILGVISIQSPIPNRFKEEDVQLLVAISKFIAVAVSNILAHERVQSLNAILYNEKKAMENAQERIAHMAYHDSLTSLPNRQALEDNVTARISRPNQVFHLVFIDLDGFKPVNDRYGHRVGDEVLIVVSKRLTQTLRSKDQAFRAGGDEFVLIVEDFNTESDLQNFLLRILQVIEQPMLLNEVEVSLSASIGSAQYPVKGTNLDALMHNADSAMYEIKRSGKGGVKTF